MLQRSCRSYEKEKGKRVYLMYRKSGDFYSKEESMSSFLVKWKTRKFQKV